MSLAALDDIDDAIDATRSLLWPFDLGRWARLALVVFFLGGTGTVNPTQFTNFGSTGTPSEPGTPTDPMQIPSVSEIVNALSPAEWAIVGAVVGTILLISLGFAFVGAVMEFVFVESLGNGRVSVREFWSRRWRQGARLFGFRLVVGLLSLLVGGGAVLAALWPAFSGGAGAPALAFDPDAISFAAVAAAFGVFAVVAIVTGLLTGFTTQFVVPVMVAEDRTVLGAWRRFWGTLIGEWKEYLVYLVARFVLGIAVGIAVGIVSLIAAIALGIPFGLLGLVGGYLVLAMGVTAGWVIVAIAVALYVLSLLVLGLFAAVPVQTFMRYYALLVLGDTNADFDVMADIRRDIRGGDGA